LATSEAVNTSEANVSGMQANMDAALGYLNDAGLHRR
jgi:hypothetical protein